MSEKDLKGEDPNKSQDNADESKLEWLYCPICGNELPKIKNLKFCIKCRTNITYIKKHKKFPPRTIPRQHIRTISYPEYYPSKIHYGIEKISDENITKTKDLKLWGTLTSLGLPIGAYIIMNFVVAGFFVMLTFFTTDLDSLIDLLYNPFFIIFSSFFELIFIIVPVIYVGKYLQTPSFENRLILLGFTSRGYERKGIQKEVLIGLAFAVIGIIVVVMSSIFIEIILEIIFGVEIVRDVSGATSDVEIIVSSLDIFSLIIFAILMILIIGTSEEILFRGFMQKGLVRNLGNIWGIIISALIFAFIHLIGILFIASESPLTYIISFFLSFVPYFSISLMIGWLYYWRNENLIAVVITHGVYDAITITLAFIVYGMA
ncbi:MAG: lysostaphin resistance A-like protein [Candidatus Hodarchaeota archaeon]